MKTKKNQKSLFFILLFTIGGSFQVQAQQVKADITLDIRKPAQHKSWQQHENLYPEKLYKATAELIEEKVLNSQKFIKLSDMLHNYWQRHTHKK